MTTCAKYFSATVIPIRLRLMKLTTQPVSAWWHIVLGTGVQKAFGFRWGDYSAMVLDPVDDCTFWYTQEYQTSTGFFDWKTRIAACIRDARAHCQMSVICRGPSTGGRNRSRLCTKRSRWFNP